MENRIIVDYKLVECKNVDDLTHDVSALIRLDGWQPLGVASCMMDDGFAFYTQTLVKYSTEQDKD